MATKKPSTAVVPYKEPTESTSSQREIDKPTPTWKRWWFPIVLLVAVGIAWIVLFSAGMQHPGSNPFAKLAYARELASIVTVFHVVILIYPVFLIVKNKAWVRLIVVAAMILGMWMLLVVQYITAVGEGLWGPKILGVVALVLSAVAAYGLTRYRKVDHTLDHQAASLPERQQEIGKLRRQREGTGAKLKVVTAATEALHKEHSEQDNKAKASSEAFTKAGDDFNASTVVSELNDLNAALEKAARRFGEIPDEQAVILAQIEKAEEKGLKKATALRAKFSLLEEEHENLSSTVIPDLKRKVEEAQHEVDISPEKKALDTAAKANEDDSALELVKRDKHAASNKRQQELTNQFTEEEAAENHAQSAYDEIVSKQNAANQTRILEWRDDIAWPLIAAILALLLYPAWYGWVATEVF